MFNSASLHTAHEDRFRRAMLASGVGMAIVDLWGVWRFLERIASEVTHGAKP